MKSPYRMGFEIVHKNDDNTRMVGIFVFRVNKDLFYAPVFFLNGSIKGTDLFYRASIKRFVPLTQDWVEYLVNLAEHQEGHGVPITYRSQLRNQLNMREIVHPPNSAYKYASDHGAAIKEASAETRAAVTEMEKLCDLEQGILKRFIVEDGGFDAMRKIANTAQRDFAFARALVECCDVDSYHPALEATVKVAGVVEQHEVLTVHTGLLNNRAVKSASVDDMYKGYKIEDLRKDAVEAVFAPISESVQSVTEPGIYDILMEDGNLKEMLCGRRMMSLMGDVAASRSSTCAPGDHLAAVAANLTLNAGAATQGGGAPGSTTFGLVTKSVPSASSHDGFRSCPDIRKTKSDFVPVTLICDAFRVSRYSMRSGPPPSGSESA